MARCDEGYNCDVCGQPVDAIIESELYLRYVLGEVPLEKLHLLPERHILCNPVLAQYIVCEGFECPACEGPFAKAVLDITHVATEEARVSAAYRRLLAIPTLGLNVAEYPFTITPSEDLP